MKPEIRQQLSKSRDLVRKEMLRAREEMEKARPEMERARREMELCLCGMVFIGFIHYLGVIIIKNDYSLYGYSWFW